MNGLTRLLALIAALSASASAQASVVGKLLHPIAPACPELVSAARCLPPCARNHVHIIFLNGLDPLRIGNLAGLSDCIRDTGFENVYYGELWDGHRAAREIRRIRCHDADARIVLLGYSFGANLVRCVANRLARDGIRVDTLIYLGGDTVFGSRCTPENVCHVINVRAWGFVLFAGGLISGQDMARADNIHLPWVRHLCMPRQQALHEILLNELIRLALLPPCPCAPGAVLP